MKDSELKVERVCRKTWEVAPLGQGKSSTQFNGGLVVYAGRSN